MRKRRAFTLWEAVLVVAIIVILAALIFPLIAGSRPYPSDRKASCYSNLRQIGLGFMQYIQDSDEKYPPIANSRAGHWTGSLQPYVKSWWIFQCPGELGGVAPETTDYFANARLSGVESREIAAPIKTILSGDGKGDSSLACALSQLPDAWRREENSPARRHLGFGNYLFADGHAEAFKPGEITLDKPSAKRPTFLPR